jgi:CHAD domain-containing protein
MPENTTQLPPDSATILERSRGVFFARWAELLRLRRSVLKASDPDDIHDLRVASRRFRAALELFGPGAPKSSRVELRKNVRKLTQVLSGLRNIDEALLFFRSHGQTDSSATENLCHTLAEMRTRELKRIEKKLASFEHHSLDRLVREIVAGLNGENISKRNRFSLLGYFSDISIRLYLPIHRLQAVSIAAEHGDARHALRIAIKKWRYFFEIMAQVLDLDYSPILEQLAKYQDILGQMNDIVEFDALLCNLSLPKSERDHIRELLLAENSLLLDRFAKLAERQPLVYTFLV